MFLKQKFVLSALDVSPLRIHQYMRDMEAMPHNVMTCVVDEQSIIAIPLTELIKSADL